MRADHGPARISCNTLSIKRLHPTQEHETIFFVVRIFLHIFAVRKPKIMKRFFVILLSASLLLGCSKKMESHERPDISMAEDTTAYIEMLEQEIKERVLEEERNTRSMMLTVIFLTIIVASVIVDKIAIAKRKAEIKNKWLKRDIEKLEKEKEKYMAMYNEVQEEKEMISGMKEEGAMSEDMRNLLEERLNVLNGFITAYISGNCSEQAYNELEKLMSNRNGFIDSTRLSFAIGHPRFLIFLKEKGLTDLEIGYCCLHAIGLRGKEIVSYLNSRSYYNASSAIRKKLGLNEHDTNINIYILNLLKEIDEDVNNKKQQI